MSVRATIIRDFFSEMSQIVPINSVRGIISINNVDVNMVAVTISRYYDQSTAPPITQWIMGGVFEITAKNSTITRIRFEGYDSQGRLTTSLEVITYSDNPIVITNPGLYAVLAVATLQPQKTVTIT